jgi:hypothetical protein
MYDVQLQVRSVLPEHRNVRSLSHSLYRRSLTRGPARQPFVYPFAERDPTGRYTVPHGASGLPRTVGEHSARPGDGDTQLLPRRLGEAARAPCPCACPAPRPAAYYFPWAIRARSPPGWLFNLGNSQQVITATGKKLTATRGSPPLFIN